VLVERDSVRISLPSVSGAKDFRVFAADTSLAITATATGAEHVAAKTIVCAGFRQRGVPTASNELIQQIEFPGLTATTQLVVEAIDTVCPFAGTYGRVAGTYDMDQAEGDDVTGNYFVYTEAEIAKSYGGLLLNGQGYGGQRMGDPTVLSDPKVLARTTISVTPLGYGAPPVATFFDDFAATEDQPTQYPGDTFLYNGYSVSQNSKWTFFAVADYSQIFLDRGRLNYVYAEDDGFGSFIGFPKQTAAIPTAAQGTYLHTTYEVNNAVTDRRYWWLSFCGPDSGPTLDSTGLPLSYMNPDSSIQGGLGNVSPETNGWNCIDILPRDGTAGNGCWPLPPSNTTPETDVAVYVYPKGTWRQTEAIDVNPPQYGKGSIFNSAWYRQQNAAGELTGPMLDDVNQVAPTVRFDVYLRRDRIVMYVNGQQRLCNNLPANSLTMQNALIGFGQVLYHTADEHQNISNEEGGFCSADNETLPAGPATMQDIYYNEPYFDSRTWDNVGFGENEPLPGAMPAFDPSLCYTP
jgi:hypothetical protein